MGNIYKHSTVLKDLGKKFLSTNELEQRYPYGDKGVLVFSLKKGRGDSRDHMEAKFDKLDMNVATDEELLEWSIIKWKYLLFAMRVKKETVWDSGWKTCALCQKYLKGLSEECAGCPIKKDTGVAHCGHTPYSQYAQFKDSDIEEFYSDVYRGAERMLDYLVDLKNKIAPKRHMHILKFYSFVKNANAVGSDRGKTTIKCEECTERFAFEYERVDNRFDIQLTIKMDGVQHRFVMPTVIDKGMAVGID